MKRISAALVLCLMLIFLAGCRIGSQPQKENKELKPSTITVDAFDAVFRLFARESDSQLQIQSAFDLSNDRSESDKSGGLHGMSYKLASNEVDTVSTMYVYSNADSYIEMIALNFTAENHYWAPNESTVAALALYALDVDISDVSSFIDNLDNAIASAEDNDTANSAVDIGGWRIIASVKDGECNLVLYLI